MSFGLGLLAVTVAPCWMVLGFFVWDNHWTASAFALNLFKSNLASLGFLVVVLVSNSIGNHPQLFTTTNVGYLMLSSTVGILVGDWTWLEGMRILGARKIIVMDCFKPFLAALFGRVFVGEQLHIGAYLGLLLTIVGVLIVGLERENKTSHGDGCNEDTVERQTHKDATPSEHDNLLPSSRDSNFFARQHSYVERRKQQQQQQSTQTYAYGLINGFLNILFHTVGSTLTKIYGAGMTTWEINLIRFGFAGLSMGLISSSLIVRSKLSTNQSRFNHLTVSLPWYSLPSLSASSWAHVCSGVMCVTFLHPSMVNYAMFQVPLALLLTLDSIGPLYSLPMGWMIQGDQPTYKACIGACLSVGGIIILSLKGVSAEKV
ncbi:EamA-like transporter family protein [Nitzschia inconspicua]|uniref:EamA-like transporter family protein n=1 Tax=Nitzschia inconspicua TaxID=303405 RepID=A0A9K3PEQ8_9STRA|nr:EamA-like transporter family protein [Nitzschia inconspicua]